MRLTALYSAYAAMVMNIRCWSLAVAVLMAAPLARSQDHDIELILQYPLQFDSPADRCESRICLKLIELLDAAEDSVDFAVYGARLQTDVLEAVLRAQKRGVTVRGVVDKDRENNNYYSSTEEWIRRIGTIRDDFVREQSCLQEFSGEPGCERPEGFEGPLQCLAYNVGENSVLVGGHASREEIENPNRIMHNKFFVVDNSHIWTGSANISNSGTGGYNSNAVVVVHSEDVARVYTDEFERLWNRGSTCDKESDGVEEFELRSGRLTTWFSPQDASLRYGVGSLIARARSNINVSVFFLTDKYVTANLIAAHRRGVKVRVIIDATSAGNGYSKHEILREAGIPVKVENWGGKMHMKAASMDGASLVLGSMNWTSAGLYANDENTLLVRSKRLAWQFDRYFDDIWKSIPEEWQKPHARPDPESWDSGASCTDGVDNDFDDLADDEDPGCGEDPPPLPELPPHRIVTRDEYKELRNVYPMIRYQWCDWSYPDWFVCLPSRGKVSCDRLPYRNFTVTREDPLGLDPDENGLGCEKETDRS